MTARELLASYPIRDAVSADRRIVASTWVESFAMKAPWSRRLAKRAHWDVVDRVLDRGARVVVLGHVGGAAHAWACGEANSHGRVLHFAYVPTGFRGKGCARRLITELFDGAYPELIDTSHPWPWASRRFRWNPYSLMTSAAPVPIDPPRSEPRSEPRLSLENAA